MGAQRAQVDEGAPGLTGPEQLSAIGAGLASGSANGTPVMLAMSRSARLMRGWATCHSGRRSSPKPSRSARTPRRTLFIIQRDEPFVLIPRHPLPFSRTGE
jgi:hypothetical protein